jgi:uncharacterized membrane protein
LVSTITRRHRERGKFTDRALGAIKGSGGKVLKTSLDESKEAAPREAIEEASSEAFQAA